jgi:hypothetical protein
VLTGVVAVLLAIGGAVLPVSGPPQPDLPTSSGLSVTMTAVNDGHPVSLLDQANPGWAHPGLGNTEKVTVTVHLAGALVHHWRSHLDAPDAFQGLELQDCHGDEQAPPSEVSCVFDVSVTAGLNHLQFRFSADDDDVVASASGYLMGGSVGWNAGWEMLDATGQWSAISHDEVIALPATLPSALRYVVINSGQVPFRVIDGCGHQVLLAGAQLVCLVHGVRTVQSLAGEYRQPLNFVDVAGQAGGVELRTTIRAFTGSFSLDRSSVVVGQDLSVRSTGLPRGDDFALEYRLDQEPVLVGTTTTHSGTALLTFPLPGTSPGTVHVQVEHNGLTVASLPVDVTLVPRKVDAAPPVWPWLLLLVPLAGLIVLLTLRSRRRRRRAAA